MDQQGLVRKMAIGPLQPGTNTAMVVVIIISKSDPRKVTMKKDGTDRWVTTFTLRDCPSVIIYGPILKHLRFCRIYCSMKVI